jgi:hypothetical protein
MQVKLAGCRVKLAIAGEPAAFPSRATGHSVPGAVLSAGLGACAAETKSRRTPVFGGFVKVNIG